jgi:hypothetical protein
MKQCTEEPLISLLPGKLESSHKVLPLQLLKRNKKKVSNHKDHVFSIFIITVQKQEMCHIFMIQINNLDIYRDTRLK